MACYSPLNAYKKKTNKDGKLVVTFRRNESLRGERINLPCGQCVGCRLERSRQWAVRCMHEAQMHEKNCFITLTYEDKNLPPKNSLDKTHFQKFMKRLRKRYGSGIRYYQCGEYGDIYLRPHYHALLFNHDFDDKKYFSVKNGNKTYTSDELNTLWSKGFAVIGDVTFESAAYVARYVMKKVYGKNSSKYYGDRIPEYTTMSRGSRILRTGGIGKSYYEKFKSDIYPNDRVIVRGLSTRPPRFYDSLLEREDRALYMRLKIEREEKANVYVEDTLSNGKRILVPETDSKRLLVKEEVTKSKISVLKRNLEK